MADSKHTLFSLLLILLISAANSSFIPEIKEQQDQDVPYVGVNIGTDVSNFVSPAELVSFLQLQKITRIRLYDANTEILKALAKTKIWVIISVPNNQLLGIGSSNATAATWIGRNVAAYYPETAITAIAVGDEVLTTIPSSAPLLIPAIESLYNALVASNLHTQGAGLTALPIGEMLLSFTSISLSASWVSLQFCCSSFCCL